MHLIEHVLGSFRPVEPVWCCDRCRKAALAAEAESRGGTNHARARARQALASARISQPPASRQTSPQ